MTTNGEPNEGNGDLSDKVRKEVGEILDSSGGFLESPLEKLTSLAGTISSKELSRHESAKYLLHFMRRAVQPEDVHGTFSNWLYPSDDYKKGQRLAESQITLETLENKDPNKLTKEEENLLIQLKNHPPEYLVYISMRNIFSIHLDIINHIRNGYKVTSKIQDDEGSVSNHRSKPRINYLLFPDDKILELENYLKSMVDHGITKDPDGYLEDKPTSVVKYVMHLHLNGWASEFMTGFGYAEHMLEHGRGDKAVEFYHALRILEHRSTVRKLEIAMKDPQNRTKIVKAMQYLGYGK